MEDKTLHMTMLFDFFGDLLTDKQREYFDLYYNEDLSLSEIAKNVGITKQGVFDIILRAEKLLISTENKTGLVARFREMQNGIADCITLAEKIEDTSDNEAGLKAKELVARLEILKGRV